MKDIDIAEVKNRARFLNALKKYPINENKDLYVRALDNYNEFVFGKISNESAMNNRLQVRG